MTRSRRLGSRTAHRAAPLTRTYDALFSRFEDLEDAFDLPTANSPTQRVGGAPVDELERFVEVHDDVAGSLDVIEQDIEDLETDLNDRVYELYDVDDDTREYIEETVDTPTTPIRPKAMSDNE